MNKLKYLAVTTIGVLAFLLITGVVKAEPIKTTPTEFVQTLVSVPGKIHNQIGIEIEKTKEFQKRKWEESKIQFANLKKLFIKN